MQMTVEMTNSATNVRQPWTIICTLYNTHNLKKKKLSTIQNSIKGKCNAQILNIMKYLYNGTITEENNCPI
jgi:hypothetical protein